MPGDKYLEVADTWPLNPNGEITMGFKLENRHGVENAEELMAVKGLAFAEPGPSDNGWSYLGWDAVRPMSREDRAKVMANAAIYRGAGAGTAGGQEEQHHVARHRQPWRDHGAEL